MFTTGNTEGAEARRLTRLEHWTEWKRLCALDLCSRPARTALTAFARLRFSRYTAKYIANRTFRFDDAWHLFEAHMTIKQTGQGKRYKDWLFGRLKYSEDPPVDIIQGGATLIMRDVVRDFLSKESAAQNTISLDKPLDDDGSPLTMLDLIAADNSTFDRVCELEYQRLADVHARDLYPDTGRRNTAALLAKQAGVALSHPLVEAAAGCRKSVLNDSYNRYVRKVARYLQKKYPEDGAESVLALTLMTLRKITELLFAEKYPEKEFAELFVLMRKRRNIKIHGTAEVQLETCV